MRHHAARTAHSGYSTSTGLSALLRSVWASAHLKGSPCCLIAASQSPQPLSTQPAPGTARPALASAALLSGCGKSSAQQEPSTRGFLPREVRQAKALFEERCKTAGVVVKRASEGRRPASAPGSGQRFRSGARVFRSDVSSAMADEAEALGTSKASCGRVSKQVTPERAWSPASAYGQRTATQQWLQIRRGGRSIGR